MPLGALVLILLSAAAHATWNYLYKLTPEKALFSWSFCALASLLFLPLGLGVLVTVGLPWPGPVYLAGTMLLHALYFAFLGRAYAQGDLSLTYPVARGTGVLLTPLLGALFLGESVSPVAVLGIATIVGGLLVVHGVVRPAKVLAALRAPGARAALATGLVIAGYSVWDKQGVGVVSPLLYNYGVFLAQALAAAPVALRRRSALRALWRRHWPAIGAAAVLSPLAYLLVLVAMTVARVSYVAPAREIGIVFGTALGVVLLREPAGRLRLLGAALITLGVVILALAP